MGWKFAARIGSPDRLPLGLGVADSFGDALECADVISGTARPALHATKIDVMPVLDPKAAPVMQRDLLFSKEFLRYISPA